MHHGAGLRAESGNAEWVDALIEDFRTAPIAAADRAMLDYADKLTRTPAAMTEADVVALRDAGFDDRAILDINQVTGYFAYVNRLADGLGVALEARWGENEQPTS